MTASLPDSDVRAILAADDRAARIAARHGVSIWTVYRIKRLQTKIARRVRDGMQNGEAVIWPDGWKRGRLSPNDVRAIRSSTRTSPDLACEYGVSESLIRMVWTGKIYKGVK